MATKASKPTTPKTKRTKKTTAVDVIQLIAEITADTSVEDDIVEPVEELAPEPAPIPVSKTVYLSNKELLAEVRACKKTGQMSNKLVRMLQLLCSRFAKKGSFVNYSYNEDMQAYAMMMLVRTWMGFNPEKSTNAFAFFTQCIKNSFIQYLKHEERQRNVRDLLMINQGLNPSYGYDDGIDRGMEDERDYDHMRTTLEAQSRDQFVDTPIERDDKGAEIAPVVTPEEEVEDAD
jgi:DNA-directed RNA polymerase specialized sigma subunit